MSSDSDQKIFFLPKGTKQKPPYFSECLSMCPIQRTLNLDMQRALWKRRKEVVTEVNKYSRQPTLCTTHWKKAKLYFASCEL